MSVVSLSATHGSTSRGERHSPSRQCRELWLSCFFTLGGFRHTQARFLTNLFTKMTLRNIFPTEANTNIADSVGANVSSACHHVAAFFCPPLGPFATFIPYRHPFFVCEQKRYPPLPGTPSLIVKGIPIWITLLFNVRSTPRFPRFFGCVSTPRAKLRVLFVSIGSGPRAFPRAFICPVSFSAIFAVSHRVLSYRSVVRGRIGAETSMRLRSYHHSAWSSC
jgi:hypothetical protein